MYVRIPMVRSGSESVIPVLDKTFAKINLFSLGAAAATLSSTPVTWFGTRATKLASNVVVKVGEELLTTTADSTVRYASTTGS